MCFLRLGDRINKRLGAMTKPTNIIRSGWMTKSPPEQKLQSPLKLFRARWKQRFFVLHKPSGSLPDQYELSYFNSESCSKKRGKIDLDQCEQIIESLDSDQYPYLLAVKTVCKGKVRTYYLATSSEEDMGEWVQCLCRVCGLKQEDTPTDIPDSRLSIHGMAGDTSTTAINASTGTLNRTTVTASPTVTTQPVQSVSTRTNTLTSSSTSSSNSIPPPSTSPGSYFYLNECTTGTSVKRPDKYGRTDSIDSVPEYQAPPPPIKKFSQQQNNNTRESRDRNSLHDSVFDVYDHPPKPSDPTDVYDRPPRGGGDAYDRPRPGSGDMTSSSSKLRSSQASMGDDDVYKVPPSHHDGSLLDITHASMSSDKVDLSAAVPLPMYRRSPHSTRSSLSDRPDSVDSLGRSMTENYDVPPPRPVSMSISSQEGGQTSPPPTPPLRPPKPHGLVVQSPYQNLPATSKVAESSLGTVPAAPPKSNVPQLSYDVPRASVIPQPPRDSSGLVLAPPRESVASVAMPRESALNIAPPAPHSAATAAHSYWNTVPGLSNQPSVPPLPNTYIAKKTGRDGDPADLQYADMDGIPPAPSQVRPSAHSTGSYTEMGGQDLYKVPPVAPRPPARTNTAPPRGHSTPTPGGDMPEVCPIWSTQRTKSFKRNNIVSHSPKPVRPPPLEPRRPPLPARTNDFASSSDDDDHSVDGNNTHHDLSIVRMSMVPTAPGNSVDNEPELKYLDLELDTLPDLSRHQGAASHTAPTEYREIDFVKTQALQDVKKVRDYKGSK